MSTNAFDLERLKSIDEKLHALHTGVPMARAQYDELLQAVRDLRASNPASLGDRAVEDAYKTLRQALIK